MFIIREINLLMSDPNHPIKNDQFQEEIDSLYMLIYEELKKPSPFIEVYNITLWRFFGVCTISILSSLSDKKIPFY